MLDITSFKIIRVACMSQARERTEFFYRSGVYDEGIGADDRAGCAILWLLKDSGHSLLVTNGEEIGCNRLYRFS